MRFGVGHLVGPADDRQFERAFFSKLLESIEQIVDAFLRPQVADEEHFRRIAQRQAFAGPHLALVDARRNHDATLAAANDVPQFTAIGRRARHRFGGHPPQRGKRMRCESQGHFFHQAPIIARRGDHVVGIARHVQQFGRAQAHQGRRDLKRNANNAPRLKVVGLRADHALKRRQVHHVLVRKAQHVLHNVQGLGQNRDAELGPGQHLPHRVHQSPHTVVAQQPPLDVARRRKARDNAQSKVGRLLSHGLADRAI